jgi:uncharacterized protein YgiM (DUF1202 family)
MDGSFVPNFTLGTDFIKALKKRTSIPLDIHLMINDPEAKLDWFAFGEGDYVCVTGQNDGWYRISYKNGSAYVSKDYVAGDYVKYAAKIGNEAESTVTVYGVVTAETGVKLRKEASLISNVLTVLPYGTEVNVDRVGQEWVRIITDGGQKGYVSADYLSVREGVRTTRSAGSGKGAEVVAYGKQFI